MAFHQPFCARHKILQRGAALVALAAGAHADAVVPGFLVAQDEDERHLLQSEVADLGVHLLVARVQLHAQAGDFERRLHLLGVVQVLLAGDGHQAHLHRRQPQRKRAGVVLNQHAEEALDRSKERPVNHHRPMQFAVFALVLQLKALRQVEVELHGGELPHPAQHIHQLDVDLGPVECALAQNRFERHPASREQLPQYRLGILPVSRLAHKVARLLRIAHRQLHAILAEPERLQHRLGKVETAFHLAGHLLRCAEDVRIVLRKSAHPQQSMHRT